MKDTKREHELFANCPVMEAIIRLALPTVIGQIILVVYFMAGTFFSAARDGMPFSSR